ncbi:MAG TPA: peptidoglycan DD-metalloendopeptidase family protein [Longimicrobiaceae bacterium]|jgi:murein DD-endopeptidase MepM/ murein hydrolase activator NlpD
MSKKKILRALGRSACVLALGLPLASCGTENLTEAVTAPNEPTTSVSSAATGRIATGGPYNLRSGPGTNYGVVGTIAGGTQVTITCQAYGTTHTGPWGTTNLWDRLSDGRWITDAYVYTGTNGRAAPDCTTSTPTTPPPASSGYKIPLTGGLKWRVSAGIGRPCGGVSHHGESFGISDCYAIDFTPSGRSNVAVLAAAGGTIEAVVWNVANPARPSCVSSTANRVTIKHADGTRTQYWHLAHNSIPEHLRRNGAAVRQGERLGTMGMTGCTTAMHLHFRMNTGSPSGTSAALKDIAVDGVRLRDFVAQRDYESTNAR